MSSPRFVPAASDALQICFSHPGGQPVPRAERLACASNIKHAVLVASQFAGDWTGEAVPPYPWRGHEAPEAWDDM